MSEEGIPPSKISCNSDVVQNIYKIVEEETSNRILNDLVQDDTKKDEACKRFMEIFQSTFEENITLCSGLEVPRDIKDEYLQGTLLPKLEEALKNTSQKRKSYPERCRSLHEKRLRLTRKELKRLKFKTEDEQVGVTPSSAGLTESLTPMGATVSKFTKTIQGNIEELRKAKLALKRLDALNKKQAIFYKEPVSRNTLEHDVNKLKTVNADCTRQRRTDLENV